MYPTVDGEYSSKDKIVYQGDEFTNWVQQNEFGAYFHNLLLPIASLDVFISRRYTFLKWETIIKELNPHLDLRNRVALIYFLHNLNMVLELHLVKIKLKIYF
ncbi:hypothetical protein [Polaribacter reichenbachii]|uniref:hypothetical protein n=1 Tax=Polaribacter reichenbachii TaxID=996801 RepID=UPI00083889C7|nr:hypothetical protein [Polaribacter reichenbachii]AUC20192.1 hypothetical protein BTO17_16495 [Polaribacter reichenbachii]